jgi:hypothetical protein
MQSLSWKGQGMTDEPIVFGAYIDGKGGIPIPLKTETLLDAMVFAYDLSHLPRRDRQYLAFRNRILLKFESREMLITLQRQRIEADRQQLAEKDAENQALEYLLAEAENDPVGKQMAQQLAEKDARIAELEGHLFDCEQERDIAEQFESGLQKESNQ